ncbi:ribulose-phosphate 3-epimerase [Enteropsectra breve]|nr:ribulose-phosphate 3-epimerase [Enteropsectra breve]
MPNECDSKQTPSEMSECKISVSILDLDFLELKANLEKLQSIGIRKLHVDIIDTSFAENISFGPAIVNSILGFTFDFEIHLMVESPVEILRRLDIHRIKSIKRVAVHRQFTAVKDFIMETWKGCNIKVGRAINPEEQICFTHQPNITIENDIENDINNADYLLIMTVVPGAGGQKMQESCTKKIKQAKELGKEVGVDGGVNLENISRTLDADYVVIGSAITKSHDMETSYNAFLQKIQ